ncbi:amidohydrolase family protein [Rhodopirellula maiorica SM1]|uniref:Amidohydrolase family protein n=1 Tax=Rhodopirellula maiorica SM1 TaxID=1265738 RepID=M5S115_9BACT|nr:amidohydrolase family protein [Rhodopirellula maiorica]EMI21337.1 amidohydrolase family protein [Rhodopirellula maiorica SM1]
MRILQITICLLVLSSLLSGREATAHDQIPGAEQTRPILIRGATLHPVDGDVIEEGDLLFDDGRIVAIGARVKVEKGTQIIEAAGKHVYPGLFDAMTDLGLREITGVDVTVDHAERGEKNPNVRSWVAVNPDSELIPVSRASGVLLAHVAPGGRFFQGQSAVMQLDGWTAREMNLSAPAAMCVSWGPTQVSDDDPKAEAKKRDEKLEELDQWLDRAVRYAEQREAGSAIEDVQLEALLPVIEGRLPLMVHADRRDSIESAVAYAQSRQLKLVIYGGYDAADCADLLKRYDVPVIIAGTLRLPLRRHDPFDHPFTLPQRLKAAGVKYAIGGEGPGYPGGASNVRNLPYHAGCSVAYGLAREDAVRAITLSPAEILGVSDRVGSLTTGKDATLIIADGDILETESNVVDAYIQGRKVDLSSRHTMLFDKYRKKYNRGR